MNRKSWKEFMNSGHSIYLILPLVVLWSVAPLWKGGMLFYTCLGMAAVGFALLTVKDYLDEQRTNPWLKFNPEADRQLTPYEAEMTAKQSALQRIKVASFGLLLAEIAAGFLSLTAEGFAGRVSCLLCCLLPMVTLALYLSSGKYATITEPESNFVNCGFGRIFGREKVCLIFHFAFAAAVWINWMTCYQRGITLLDIPKWLTLCFGIAVVLSAAFLLLSKEYRSHKILAALAIAMSAANAFALVWVVNVVCDTFPAKEYEVAVVDSHIEERIRNTGAHHEYYLTVEYEDGSLLDLYEPYDFDVYTEGDRLSVRHHRGVLGIEWAEFVQ